MAIIELKNITKTFEQDGKIFDAVKDASVSVEKGEIYGIIGFSGAGKSTLVRTINLLGRPTSGQVIVKGRDFLSLSEKELRQERKKIGMIFYTKYNVELILKYLEIYYCKDEYSPINWVKISKDSYLGVIDNNGIRKLTLREGLRLNGYPDSYKLDIDYNKGMDLLGNTVVVPVIKMICDRIVENERLDG